MKNKLAGWVAVAALLAGPGAAWAVPVHWRVGPSTIGNTTLSGSFDYDADTGTYTNVNIARTGGNFPATTFTVRQQPRPFWPSHAVFFSSRVTGSFAGQPVLLISAPNFSNAGGQRHTG